MWGGTERVYDKDITIRSVNTKVGIGENTPGLGIQIDVLSVKVVL